MKTLLLCLLVSLTVHAEERSPIEALYEKGSYAQVIQGLQKLSAPQLETARMQMLWGLSAFKLQNFAEAADHLDQVGRLASATPAPELKEATYFLGQSQYALKNFTASKVAFEKSIASGVQVDASNYYIGFIDNLLNKDDDALARLNRLAKNKSAEKEFRQAAAVQVGEIYFERSKKISIKDRSREVLRNLAVPAYEEAIDIDSNSNLGKQSENRIEEIRNQLNDSVPRTASGVSQPLKSWVVSFGEEFKYDTNIIGEADGKVIKVSDSSSFLNKTSANIKNEFIFRNWLAATPELGADHTYHWRQDVPEVFTNDAIVISPAARFRLDHKVLEKPAAGLVEYEFNYTLKDINKLHHFDYYTKNNNFILGERLQFFGVGSTTLKANFKLSENANEQMNYLAPGLFLSQNVKLFQNHLLNTSLSSEYQRAKSEFFDQRNYKVNLTYSWPKTFWKIDTTVGFNLTITDTMNQRTNRGTEKTYNPTLGLTRAWGSTSFFSTSLNYAYTKNVSNDRLNYAYTKHVIGLAGNLIF